MYVFVFNSWLHPTVADLQQHTCTAPPPPHGDLQQREWGEEGGLAFSPGAYPRVVWIKASYSSNSPSEGVQMLALSLHWAQQRVSHGWGWGVMGAGGSWCPPAPAPRPREGTAFTGQSEVVTEPGLGNTLSSCRNIRCYTDHFNLA